MATDIPDPAAAKSVLMAVDESEHSDYAFTWYVKHFHKPETKMYLVHCPETYANVTMMSPGKVQELIKECEKKVEAIKIKYLAKMKANGIRGEFERLHGERPGHAIIECAVAKNITFIVTGTRGQSKVRRTLMGSVSDYVIHHSPVPVLVCRHRSDSEKEKEMHKMQQERDKAKKQQEKQEKEKEKKKADPGHGQTRSSRPQKF